MRISITVGELMEKGKLPLLAQIFPELDFSPTDLIKELELNEDQAARLGLIVKPQIKFSHI